ncbi:hypothetical protein CIB95_10470 [Lottiidibacillus patelloidae]|uniref:non-specific protein-tyrosine kinase n=1 Tax=Lottiidibacillus patelloidae TaxID=2670334 RepID=A0A263BSE9_9BACI|nr:polysaccharide biosynthesis tyrosine autokinase [Lottiidibacillus patelloidae]OZM56640.1 hypothetical protein CIB95_10470 [Lottiidibacillus patelloidae]
MEFVFDIREFFKLLFRNWRVIFFLTGFVVLISSVITLYVIPPEYEARVNILVTTEKDAEGSKNVTASEIDSSLKLIDTYRVIIKSPTILEPALKNINKEIDIESLLRKIEIESIKNSQVFTIIVKDQDHAQAVYMANSIANVFKEEVDRLKNLNYIHILTPAKIDDSFTPVDRNPIFNIAISLFLGLFLSVGSVSIKEFLDTTIKSEEKIRRLFSLSVLGEVTPITIGKNKSSKANNELSNKLVINRRSSNFSNYQNLCARLKLSPSVKKNQTMLITSPNSSEGKSLTSANVAIMMAKSTKKTVYIDMNLRGPTGHIAFNLSNDRGVSSFLAGQDQLSEIIQKSDEPNLSIVTSGSVTINPVELFESERFQQLFTELRVMFDIIVIDSPSMDTADTMYLSSEADGCVLVVNPGKTRIDATYKAVEKLKSIQANILGIVLNNKEK